MINKTIKVEETKKDSLKLLFVFIIIVIVIWVASLLILRNMENRGTFGDMFGAVNALFSGLALSGIIFTILLQKKELGLQRLELAATRSEFHQQNETLRIQRFENTFFNMITNHQQIVNGFQLLKDNGYDLSSFQKKSDEFLQGQQVIKHLYEEVKLNYAFYSNPLESADTYRTNSKSEKGIREINYAENKEIDQEYAFNCYWAIYKDNKIYLSHYFRNLKSIMETISFSEIENKEDYFKILKAQLSSYELLLLFYHGFSRINSEPFKHFLEEFSFFERNFFPFDDLLNSKHTEFYHKKSYESGETWAE